MSNKYESVVKQFGDKELSSLGTSENLPVSEAQLAQYEADLGYKLPADYREFLRNYAGIPIQAAFLVKDNGLEGGSVDMFQGIWPVKEMDAERERTGLPAPFPIEYAPSLRKVLQIDEEITEVDDPPRELLPIAIDAGGNQVYLALAGLQPGAIFLWMNWQDIYLVADSFDEFMHSLRPVDE